MRDGRRLMLDARSMASAAFCACALACGAPVRSSAGSEPTPIVGSAATDTVGSGVVPAGFGTLRQEELAIRLQVQDILIQLVPLDESVIRVLSPDSYRALRQLAESRNDEITRLVTMHGVRERRLWYVTFFGLAPDARFTPTDLTLTSAGREFRPLEIIPLRAGFGEQRLQPRESQSALYLFDDGLDVGRPLTVISGSRRNDGWGETLRTIERERALIRSRATQSRNP
jgi:hypothetical protein